MLRLCLALLLVFGTALGIYENGLNECVDYLRLLPMINKDLSSWTKHFTYIHGRKSNLTLSSSNRYLLEFLRRLTKGMTWNQAVKVCIKVNHFTLGGINSGRSLFSDRDVHILGAKDSGLPRVERQITRQQQTASPTDNRRSAHVARKSESIHDAENSSPEADPKYMRFGRTMNGH